MLSSSSRVIRRRWNSFVAGDFQRSQVPRVPQNEPHPDVSTPEGWEETRQSRAQLKLLVDFMTPFGSTQQSHNTWKPRDGLRNPPKNITLSALLASGAHFGHATSRLNPSFMPYAYGERAGITIIDLDQTLPLLRRAANLVRAVTMRGGKILFLGTRSSHRPIVQAAARRLQGHGFYVAERWIPGTLSNRQAMFDADTLSSVDIDPDLVVILNPTQNVTAIAEFTQHNIPTIGLIDTDVDPRVVTYPIPSNDESTRTAELVCGLLSVAAREGISLFYESQRAQSIETEKDHESQEHVGQEES